MARTQAADYEQRREAIVEAAAKLYAERGFQGASLADLAERCNSSKSLIYHYYASKEDILFDVMATHVDALNAIADRVDAETGEPKAKLLNLTRAFMGLYVGASASHKVLLNELDRLPAERKVQIVMRQRRLIGFVDGLLGELQPKLRRSRKLKRPATMLFFGMINWTHTWYDPAGPASSNDIADLAVHLMLGGLAEI